MTRHLLAISIMIWLAGCGEAPQSVQTPANAAGAVAVRIAEVSAAEVPSTYEATGTVRARTVASISAQLMGSVSEVKVQIGDRVKTGQLLVVLDAQNVDARLRGTQAAREEVQGAFPEADSGIAAAKANLDLAQVTFNRMQDLYNKRSISNQEFDEASAKLKSAQAAHEMARARRAQLDARLNRAEQDVRAAQINFGHAEVAAPFDGVVVAKSVEPGSLAMPGVPLLTIEREGIYRLEALVDESHMPAIRIGQSVTVALDGVGRTLNGNVSEIVPEVDAAARAGTVKIDLPATAGLRSGIFGRARFGAAGRRTIVIPAAAVTERGQLQSVAVAESGKARIRLVTLGARTKDTVEVLSGLNEGDSVIVSAPRDLVDGTMVEITR